MILSRKEAEVSEQLQGFPRGDFPDPRSLAFAGGMCWAQRETVVEGNGQVKVRVLISPAYDPNSKDTWNSHAFCVGTH